MTRTTRFIPVLLPLLLLFGIEAPALAQATPPPGNPQKEKSDQKQDEDEDKSQDEESTPEKSAETESAVTEEHLAVWKLQATAAMKEVPLSETEAENVAELYLKTRSLLEERKAGIRAQWQEYRRQMLEQAREGGFIGPGLFATDELNFQLSRVTTLERRRFAEELVKVVERPTAEKLFPRLATFEPQVDRLSGMLVGYELDDEQTVRGIGLVQQFAIDAAEAKRQAERRDESAAEGVKAAKRDLIEGLRPMLDDSQLLDVGRVVGMDPRRTGAGRRGRG